MLHRRAQRKAAEKTQRLRARADHAQDMAELSRAILPRLEKDLTSAHNAVAQRAERVASHQTPCAMSADLDLRAPQFSIANVAIESEYLGEPLALSPDKDIPSLDLPQPAWGAHNINSTPQPPKSERAVGRPSAFKLIARWAVQALTPNGVVDSGATGHFLQTGVGIPMGKPSRKVVGIPNGQKEKATRQVLLPNANLSLKSCEGDELPSLRHNSLISVPKLADYDYVTVFKSGQDGLEVYKKGDI